MRFADLEAVTVDAYGTIVKLRDPVPALRAALRARGAEFDDGLVREAFKREGAYYGRHSARGRDAESLAELRRDCVAVFLRELRAELDAGEFTPAFMDSLSFEVIAGTRETLEQIRGRGARLAVISNWDVSLHERLAALELADLFEAVVTSAEAGTEKPDPAIFQLALTRLGVDADRSLHVGNEPADEQGALAAGMQFAPAPLAKAFAAWR